jgi:hypothetical protein
MTDPVTDQGREEKVVCRLCHAPAGDCEPMSGHGEFWHPRGGTCPNAGTQLSPEDRVPWAPKGYRRARMRGARQARKFR